MYFSIITCSHNPDLEIFKKLINSLINIQTTQDVDFEWIIIDNNSIMPIRELALIDIDLLNIKDLKIINEHKPGLTNARLCGIKNAKYDWIIFLDDDNEPQSDYLLEVNKLIHSFNDVACWGPGEINVKYTNNKTKKWLKFKKNIYQDKHFKEVRYANTPYWNDLYPFGSGLICSKYVLNEYSSNVINGNYSLTDRLGKDLTSGGDIQIVLTAIKLGFKAGVSGTLAINHLINYEKTKFKYLRKLFFNLNNSHLKAVYEVFPSQVNVFILKNNLQIIKCLLKLIFQINFKLIKRYHQLLLIGEIGILDSSYFALNKQQKPFILKLLISLVKI